MRFPGVWPVSSDPKIMIAEKVRTSDFLRTRGTVKIPSPPRDIIAQSGPRGVLLTWSNPNQYSDVTGWRIYKGDENTLYTEIRDRGNRQCFVESTAATISPVSNFFISSVNSLGKESQKVQAQKAALNESGAPAMPGSPPGFTSYSKSTTFASGKIRQNI